MKKFTILFALLVLVLNIISAKDVDINTAQLVAKNYFTHEAFKQASNLKEINLSLVYTENTVKGSPVYYVFNNSQQKGFIIIAGDDAALPILGYCTKGQYDKNKLNPTFLKWMEGYKKQIAYIRDHNIAASETVLYQWKSIKTNNFSKTEGVTSVDPLVTVIWGQDPFVNDKCPYDVKEAKNCVTGCPATAMAQIMKYSNHPVQGTGFHSYQHPDYGTLSVNYGNTTYDWANMPNDVTTANDAVATLMSHCGIACNMQYSPNSSGAFILEDSPTPEANSQYAYKTYFGYDPSIQGKYRSDYSDQDWINLLKVELDAKRPMQYAGFGGGGHTFVCDGYDDNDMFHMNWGWNGVLNGFYALNALNPGSGGTGSGEGTYNADQQAIIGIKPKAGTLASAPIFGLKLNSSIAVLPTSIPNGGPFSVQVDLGYLGAADLTTDIAALVFTNDGVFVDYVEYLPGKTFTSGSNTSLTFNSAGFSSIIGKHQIGIYSSVAGDSTWHLIKQATFINPVTVNVTGPPNDIKLNSTISASKNPIIVGASFYVGASIINKGTTAFNGNLTADVFDSEGKYVQTIEELTGISIPAGGVLNSLVFTSPGLNLDPGSYYIAIFSAADLINYTILSNDLFDNPILIDFVDPPLVADIYESNNNKSNAYNLPVNFIGNMAVVNTTGSNIHVGEDIDHYKVVLAPGFKYDITARVNDQYNSGNGNIYSCDVYFTYDAGSGESDQYDDILPGSIVLNDGGTIDFKVSPFYVGFTGTYELDMTIDRSFKTSTNEILENSIKIYPTPASNTVNVELKDHNLKIEAINIQNNLGQTIRGISNLNDTTEKLQFDVSDLSNGIYFLQVQYDNHKTINKKIVIAH